jgi:hypothetical protein
MSTTTTKKRVKKTAKRTGKDRPKGSITPHVELIGRRSGMDCWELLWYGEYADTLRDMLIEDGGITQAWRGCDEYRVLEPGQRRPCDIFENSATESFFIGKADLDDFVYHWIEEHDQRKAGNSAYSATSNDFFDGLTDEEAEMKSEEQCKLNPIGWDLRVTADQYDELADDINVIRDAITSDQLRLWHALRRQTEMTRHVASLLRSMVDTYTVESLQVVEAANESLVSFSGSVGDLMQAAAVSTPLLRLHHHLQMVICFEMRGNICGNIRDARNEINRETR